MRPLLIPYFGAFLFFANTSLAANSFHVGLKKLVSFLDKNSKDEELYKKVLEVDNETDCIKNAVAIWNLAGNDRPVKDLFSRHLTKIPITFTNTCEVVFELDDILGGIGCSGKATEGGLEKNRIDERIKKRLPKNYWLRKLEIPFARDLKIYIPNYNLIVFDILKKKFSNSLRVLIQKNSDIKSDIGFLYLIVLTTNGDLFYHAFLIHQHLDENQEAKYQLIQTYLDKKSLKDSFEEQVLCNYCDENFSFDENQFKMFLEDLKVIACFQGKSKEKFRKAKERSFCFYNQHEDRELRKSASPKLVSFNEHGFVFRDYTLKFLYKKIGSKHLLINLEKICKNFSFL